MKAVAFFVPEMHVLETDTFPGERHSPGTFSEQGLQGVCVQRLHFPEQYAIVAKIKSQMSTLLAGENQRRIKV